MINAGLLKQKIDDIALCYDQLEKLLKKNTHDIVADSVVLPAVERYFQRIVDDAIDVNTHIIAEKKFHPSDDYQGTFSILGENKILESAFAAKIAPSVGLRNGIVHNYEKISKSRMIELIKNNLTDYAEYVKQIAVFLEKARD